MGTMLWMAPEMLEPPVEGETAPDGYSGDKVDVYSLGIVFWNFLNGVSPDEGSLLQRGKSLTLSSAKINGCRFR